MLLFSAANCKKRSSRADECSGPCPSKACGKNNVRPLRSPHFARALDIKLSNIICAMFEKSPYCASQILKLSLFSTL